MSGFVSSVLDDDDDDDALTLDLCCLEMAAN